MIKGLKSCVALLVAFTAYLGAAVLTDVVLRAAWPERFPKLSETQAQDDVMLAIEVVSQIASGFLGGFLAARLAPARPMGHALVLGGICFVLSVAATLQVCLLYPWWYLGVGLLSTFPSFWAGGHLGRRPRERNKRDADRATGASVQTVPGARSG